jgi:hypothetical protein
MWRISQDEAFELAAQRAIRASFGVAVRKFWRGPWPDDGLRAQVVIVEGSQRWAPDQSLLIFRATHALDTGQMASYLQRLAPSARQLLAAIESDSINLEHLWLAGAAA